MDKNKTSLRTSDKKLVWLGYFLAECVLFLGAVADASLRNALTVQVAASLAEE